MTAGRVVSGELRRCQAATAEATSLRRSTPRLPSAARRTPGSSAVSGTDSSCALGPNPPVPFARPGRQLPVPQARVGGHG